ncbi:hypothetical protein DEJ21_17860 [Curtobacterium sp. MCSS17_006]|nr:hypothetical protein DEJ21_17860 [Curtobacterium sp. MCSS17_006]
MAAPRLHDPTSGAAHERSYAGGTSDAETWILSAGSCTLAFAFFVTFVLVEPDQWLLSVPIAFGNLVVVISLARRLRASRADRGTLRLVAIGAMCVGLLSASCVMATVVALFIALSNRG